MKESEAREVDLTLLAYAALEAIKRDFYEEKPGEKKERETA